MHIGQPLIRGLRALVFAVACVAVTAALHFIASGSLICFETFAIAVAVLTPLAYCLGGRQRGMGVLTAATALAQTGMHLWFTAAPEHAHHAVPSPGMILAHALAMCVTALWLARGDAALAVFLDLLILAFGPGLWLRLLKAEGPVLPPRRFAGAPEVVRPQLAFLAAALPRRGPPAAVFSR
ncbi:hypothetical protein [Glycomyces rhizosphaerae]|uniref:MFS transporter n=1 Tax=Glycomyces rhizosphaerae TaxID=2054422 RepID=A0ABV7Q4M9_9ACTN